MEDGGLPKKATVNLEVAKEQFVPSEQSHLCCVWISAKDPVGF